MSYCSIITFKNGKPNGEVEYRNSWGGTAYIWDALFEKYLKDPNKEYDTWLCNKERARDLWQLSERPDIPLYMRAVLAATFDYAIVGRQHFKEFAKHLREFVQYFGTRNRVCHLIEWADYIEKCKAEAVGFYGTSVSRNLWFDWDEKKDKSIPYNLNKRDDHFEVYDWLVAYDAAILTAQAAQQEAGE